MTNEILDAHDAYIDEFEADESNGARCIQVNPKMLRDLVATARRAIPQPIETVPKDETRIIILNGFNDWIQTYWDQEREEWANLEVAFGFGRPLFWIPAPITSAS